mmetsp:Transcript_16590/g.24565  ORF Transcript_16590/g.24565 Transcript_16590/m.24565 type:complete len:97 (-) Transcript_16590:6-296(-)
MHLNGAIHGESRSRLALAVGNEVGVVLAGAASRLEQPPTRLSLCFRLVRREGSLARAVAEKERDFPSTSNKRRNLCDRAIAAFSTAQVKSSTPAVN